MEILDTIVALSKEFGTTDYVKGGGGNTSVKAGDVLWVKPSGTTLAGLTPDSFVRMSRPILAKLYVAAMPADSTAREARVKDMMADAVLPGQTGRPSVEAPLHDLLEGRYVVHTHPVLVNGMTCSRLGAEVCARLFPEALWLPYIDPGYTLSMEVRRRVGEYVTTHGRQPGMIFLQNHGVFISGNSAEEIRGYYQRVMSALRSEYEKAGIKTTLSMKAPAPQSEVNEDERRLHEVLGEAAGAAAYSPACDLPRGPLTPDHIVYAKSFPYDGPLMAGAVAEFQRRRGYIPRIVKLASGVWGIGPSAKQAALALELALDGALVQQLASAFGGVLFLSDAAREFIENWEVENYRQGQMK